MLKASHTRVSGGVTKQTAGRARAGEKNEVFKTARTAGSFGA